MPVKKQVAPKVTTSEATLATSEVVNQEVLPTLESIVLDTPAKQAYMRILDIYKKQNPTKFLFKEKSFIKRMLSL